MKHITLICAILLPFQFFGKEAQEEHRVQAKETLGVKEVTPVEDLMREHGVLRRGLLIYEELLKKLPLDDFPAELLLDTANILHRFIENYHEKLEEDFVFPRFEEAGKMIDLCSALKEQHMKGRILTGSILVHASELKFKGIDRRKELQEEMHKFILMYRIHASREDTELFPAFKTIISEKEYKKLAVIFEARETELFGDEGFHAIIDELGHIEKLLHIHEITP
jgi:hemerythrin-like domain-containing protein